MTGMTVNEIKDFVFRIPLNTKYPLENSLYDFVEIQVDNLGHSLLFIKGQRRMWISGSIAGVVKLWKSESNCRKALEKHIKQYQRRV